jgi:hypothetical protein
MSTIRRYANTVMAVFRIQTRTWEEDCGARGVEVEPSFSVKLFAPPGHELRADFSGANFITFDIRVGS